MGVMEGAGRVEDQDTIAVEPTDADFVRRIQGDVVLIATGSAPTQPKNIPFEDERVYDSDEILQMRHLPRTLVVVGAGVIGCEYTTIFAALGIHVTLVDRRDRLLAFLDPDTADRLRIHMALLGVAVRLRDGL